MICNILRYEYYIRGDYLRLFRQKNRKRLTENRIYTTNSEGREKEKLPRAVLTEMRGELSNGNIEHGKMRSRISDEHNQ